MNQRTRGDWLQELQAWRTPPVNPQVKPLVPKPPPVPRIDPNAVSRWHVEAVSKQLQSAQVEIVQQLQVAQAGLAEQLRATQAKMNEQMQSTQAMIEALTQRQDILAQGHEELTRILKAPRVLVLDPETGLPIASKPDMTGIE